MKFTLSWLKEHLETSATLAQITQTLTAIGLEVEQVIDPSAALKDFSVAEIVEAVQHPNADKLRVCKVNDGAAVRQVVCGAPNARAGIKVVLAKEGVKIPENGMVIKKSAIRGVESNGMLCSAHELGIGEDGGGIVELPQSAVVGDPVVKALHLDDPVIEIAITPNRADCLGVYGVARDLAAAGMGKLKELQVAGCKLQGKSPVNVKLEETSACPLFIGCYIKGVKNGPSPDWLQTRLKAIGLRPISALVDITNYMTFTYGRPLHVYDAEKLSGDIQVRLAHNETLIALNGWQYTLTNSMTAITDDSGSIGIAGIIGGISTSCSDNTKNVFLEAALFDPVSIARTGRALAIDSDARYRFERGVDPDFVKTGAEIAVRMILDLCGGEASELVIAGNVPSWKREIDFNPAKVASLGGITVAPEKINTVLAALGFSVKGSHVAPPSWRADVEGQADLVEEILRISGYDTIPSLTLPAPSTKVVLSSAAQRLSLIRKTLAAKGMTEICSWAFVPEAHAKQFNSHPLIKIINPISTDLDTMRPNLLPNLIAALAHNTARGFSSLSLFETGNVFENVTPQGHILMAAGIRSNEAVQRNHLGGARAVDLFDTKADLFDILEAGGLNPAKLQVDRNIPGWYHPSRAARISLGGKVTLGYFGEIHPLILASFDIKCKVAAFEAFLNNIPLPKSKGKARPAFAASNFQVVERDFAFNTDERREASDIVKAIESADKQLIQSVNVFDVYSGKGIDAGKKSVAVSVTLQAMDRTLSDKEITDVSQKIINSVVSLGLTLRS